MPDSRFPPGSSDSNKSILTATGLKGDQGDPALSVVLQVPSVIIPCDNAKENLVYTFAESEVQILKAGVLQTGWTLAFTTGSNCTGAVDNGVEPRVASIDVVFDVGPGAFDAGYAEFSATKSGEVTQTFRLYFALGVQGDVGATGATGITGDTGAAGATGPAGADGTGIIIVKKDIVVLPYQTGTTADGGGDLTFIDFGAPHGFLDGQSVRVGSDVTGVAGSFYVAEYISTTRIRTHIPFSEVGIITVYVYDGENLRDIPDYQPQIISFTPSIVPLGAKVLEWQLFIKDFTGTLPGPLAISIGPEPYNDPAYNDWLAGAYLNAKGALVSRDRRSETDMVIVDDFGLHLRVDCYPYWWSTAANDIELQFLLAYIDYDPDY